MRNKMAQKRKILFKTHSHDIDAELRWAAIETPKVKTDRELFLKMCREGCRNYGRKYSCPPCSPEFSSATK